MQKLSSKILSIDSVGETLREAMFGLFSEFYLNTQREVFEQDLSGKSCVLLLYADDALAGFSTLEETEVIIDREPLQIFFSGDTIVAPRYWGTPEMPRAWARHFLSRKAEFGTRRCFWFLISSGYKTYRLLPVFFKTFYPAAGLRHVGEPATAELKRLTGMLASERFGDQYDRQLGLIYLQNPTPLRAGVAPVGARERRLPDVDFFLHLNPKHALGVELACLAEIHEANLTKAGRRLLGI